MLKSILIITISVLNLEPVETAYQEYFQYKVAERGVVSEELSTMWATEDMAGRDYLLMQPASDAEVYLRFIENDPVAGYAPLTTYGWNSTELLVQDPDALAKRLTGSPFEVIGPPKDLWDSPTSPRIMQAKGPGDEVLYLTRNDAYEINTPVDRAFILVAGGPSIDEITEFYRERLGVAVGKPSPYKITMISKAHGLPMDTAYPLAIASLSKDFLLEFDGYPPEARARPIKPGHLPPGTAMVSFEVDDIDGLDVEWRAAPQAIAAFPYNGRKAGVTVGAAGEWIELIELEK